MIFGIVGIEVLIGQAGIEVEIFETVTLDKLIIPIEDLGLDRHLVFVSSGINLPSTRSMRWKTAV
jgi:hypothetical protein